MREEIGDIMQKLKKAAAVAVMVGGIGLVGGGVASAGEGHYSDPYPGGFAVNNLQLADCQQSFDGGAAFVPANGAVTGDLNQNIGNFCSNVNLGH
ncbi:hypothetical protein [Streptomyces hyaluromycini]|uniref:hypothetical protein n=1 Tax=Streptomyces hyaluromycini TaxID=1377993 RepID=UPI001237A76F|nr:hypothetical protein [Streptomyces hyaluromycini]